MTNPVLNFVPDLIITHKNCPDGFGAAWAMYKRFGRAPEYVEADYGAPPPIELLKDRRVVIADVAFERSVMEKMQQVAKNFLLLDHHVSQQKEVEGLPGMHFDLSRSGAALAWLAAHPNKPMPKLLQLIEDRDLWSFKLPNTKELLMLVNARPQTFQDWDELDEMLEKRAPTVLAIGQEMLKARSVTVRKMAQSAVPIEIDGLPGLLCNVHHMDASDVGQELYNREGVAFALTYHHKDADTVSLSFRSKNGSTHDGLALRLAKQYGGGGHPNAAGARTTPSLLAELIETWRAPVLQNASPEKQANKSRMGLS